MDFQKDNTKDMTIDHFRYISLKLEKLTGAVSLVSSYITNNPLREKLQASSLDVLELSLTLRKSDLSYKYATLENLSLKIDLVLTFIGVALTDRTVSEMNLTILKNEYESLKRYIQNVAAQRPSFEVSVESLAAPAATPISSGDRSFARPNFSTNAPTTRPHSSYPPAYNNQASPAASVTSGANNNGHRREVILEYIKKHGASSINEVASAVPGVSTKTVQRELVALVDTGVLRKMGDRRWSRYELV